MVLFTPLHFLELEDEPLIWQKSPSRRRLLNEHRRNEKEGMVGEKKSVKGKEKRGGGGRQSHQLL